MPRPWTYALRTADWQRRQLLLLLVALVSFLVPIDRLPATPVDENPAGFRAEIAPLLFDHCLPCHGTKKAEGGYRVDTFAELVKAGDSGVEPIVDGDADASELLRRLTCDASERMPADDQPLAEQQIALVRQWIVGGATFDGDEAARQLPLHLVMPPRQYPTPPEHYPQALPLAAVAFTADGTQVVVPGYHELTIWNVADGVLARRIGNSFERTQALVFSPDGKTLAVAGGKPGVTGEVRLFDFASGQLAQVTARSNELVLDLAYRPTGGEQLAVASADGLIRIVDLPSMAEVTTIASHADWVTAIGWSDDGARLISGSRDKTAKVYDTSNWQLVSSYLGHGAAVRGVSLLVDGQQALSTGSDNKLHRWNVADGGKVAEVGVGSEAYRIVRVGDAAYVPCADHRLRRIDLATNGVTHTYEGHTDWVLALDVHSEQIVGTAFNGQVRVWNVADGVPQHHWSAKP